MKLISRRRFIYLSGLLSIAGKSPLSYAAAVGNGLEADDRFPTTVTVLKAARQSEMIAHRYYKEYARKALDDSYPNVAYLFSAFAIYEKIHADNFKGVLASLGAQLENTKIQVSVSDTVLIARAARYRFR